LDKIRETVRAEAAEEYGAELRAKEKRLDSLVKELAKNSKNEQGGSTSVSGADFETLQVLKKEVADVREEVRETQRPKLEKQGLSPLKDDDNVQPGDSLAIIDGGTFHKRLCTVTRVKGKKIDVTVTRGRIPFQLSLSRVDLGWPSDDLQKAESVRRNAVQRGVGGGMLANAAIYGSSSNKKNKKAANQQIKQLAASLSPSSASSSSSSSSSKIKGIRTATNTVDVRGLQLGEAQEEVLGFLMKTQASKKGARHVAYIAHGHGTGKDMNVLKNGLRQWFASGKTPVTDHAPADMEDGGDAYTIVAWGG